MRKLPEAALELHRNFLAGKFVVKRSPGLFRAVGDDMCLEQTITRSQKSTAGIIGSTNWEKTICCSMGNHLPRDVSH